MGEAKSRGGYEQRKSEAQRNAKAEFARQLHKNDPQTAANLRAGLNLFLSHLGQQWEKRRSEIVKSLQALSALRSGPENLETTPPVRIQEDEMGWYLYLCEQSLDDPLCVEVAQAQRCTPFISAIGAKLVHAPAVKGLDRKVDELLSHYKSNPDGLIFEILVALAYAEQGWDVELIEEGMTSKQSPDMVARRDGDELFVECKRLSRTTQYAEEEKREFLRVWDAAAPTLNANGQWLWLHAAFHVEAKALPTDFLSKIFLDKLPLSTAVATLHDSEFATVRARQIDKQAVRKHLQEQRVKATSPALRSLLGASWAPEDSAVTVSMAARCSQVQGCDSPILGKFIDEIGFAAGITREFDSPISIEKKARDITKMLSAAVAQVPGDVPSIIHVAAETMEGAAVEERRTEKVLEKVASFLTDKPVAEVRFHRIHAHSRVDMLFEIDERVDRFVAAGVAPRNNTPQHVFMAKGSRRFPGNPWD